MSIPLSQELLASIRLAILAIGWPVLIFGSIFLTYKAVKFYRELQRSVVGKLVLIMVLGWFVSMYSLGIVATSYMLTDLERGVYFVLPIFLIWAITMAIIAGAVLRWTKEAETLSAFYRGLEELVERRTEELKKAYEAQHKQEENIQKLRERFVSVVAHEVRSPIAAVGWALSELVESKDIKDSLLEEEYRILKEAEKKNSNLRKLVEELLTAARTQEGDLPKLPIKETDVKKVVEELQPQIEKLAQEHRVSVTWDILAEELPPVRANPLYLAEILTNLLTNAIKYNKEEGWVKLAAEQGEGYMTTRVQDSGIGMTEGEVQRLFKPFYRANKKENSGGTGLGLFITKQLVELMGGEIWIESEKDKGSTFSFSLPYMESAMLGKAEFTGLYSRD